MTRKPGHWAVAQIISTPDQPRPIFSDRWAVYPPDSSVPCFTARTHHKALAALPALQLSWWKFKKVDLGLGFRGVGAA